MMEKLRIPTHIHNMGKKSASWPEESSRALYRELSLTILRVSKSEMLSYFALKGGWAKKA